MGSINILGYKETIHAPWGQLFYQMIWRHLDCEKKHILDFGSGFGITANHLAEKNHVIAIEPNEEMLEFRCCDHPYEQLVGSVGKLKTLPEESFDIIICHNVLEYIDDRKEILCEFARLLKPDGYVSVVKHNKKGKIMQKAVFEYKIDEAIKLIQNENLQSANFGTIYEYETDQLEMYSNGMLKIDKVYGVRTFYALQRNEWKFEDDWMEKMYQIECMVEEIPEFRNIAFSHHVILRHNS